MSQPPAIAIRHVAKQFLKRTIRAEYTTFKSELVRWLRREKKPQRVTHLTALKDVSLEVPAGMTMGIIGRNGAGKSTLLKLITGIYAPTSGEIVVNGRISALLDLGAGFHPDFSGRENILINGIILGMTRAEVLAKMQEIIDFSELADFIDEPVRTYSSGMYMRLAFSVATHVEPDILIVDEILAVGDAHFAHKSLAKMIEFKRQGKTILLVTHDLGSVVQWCDLAAWLDGGTVRAMGNPRDVVQQYQAEVARRELDQPAAAPRLSSVTEPPRRAVHGPQVSWSQRYGNFAVEIERVRLLDASGVERDQLTPDDALTFELTCVPMAPADSPSVGISIRKEDGTEVYGTSTGDHELVLDLSAAPRTEVRLRIDRLGLAPGMYRLDVMVRDRSGVDLDFQLGLRSFNVQSSVPERGLVRPSHRWEVVPLPEPRSAAAVRSG